MAGRKYSIEFKIQATKRVVEDGVSSAQVARELGINVNSLRDWVRRYREDTEEPFVGSGNLRKEEKTIKELEKRIRDLEEENEILKKAAAIFAQNQKR
jgi:transposase